MYVIERIEPKAQSLIEIAQLMSTCFPHADYLDVPYLRWLYEDNPQGSVVGYNAYSKQSGKLAGHYALIPVSWICSGSKKRCLLSLNTAVHPDHRRRGLFKRTAGKSYDAARAENYQIVFGVGNQNSTHGLVNSLDFKYITRLSAKVGAGALPALKKDCAYRSAWDKETLEWRLNRPHATYWAEEHRSQNVYFSSTPYPLMKVALHQSHDSYGVTQDKPRSRILTTWIGHDPDLHWGGAFYGSLPSKLKPAPLNLVALDLQDQHPDLSAETLSFEAIDFDAF